MKNLLYTCEILIKPRTGTYLVTYYYDDGTIEQLEVPKGPIFMPPELSYATSDQIKSISDDLERTFYKDLKNEFLEMIIAIGVLALFLVLIFSISYSILK